MPAPYESDRELQQYLDFHFASRDPGYLPHHPLTRDLLDYPRRCAESALQFAPQAQRALDLGCAVGGASFVLAKTIPEVIGIDLSQRFIETASELATKGRCRCGGRIYTLPEDSVQEGVRFEIGNACAPDSTLGIFDLILMANLLCRLPDPAACLHALRNLTRSGSILAIMTPCSWDESFTPREKWLAPTFDALQEHLGPWCRLLDKTDMPFVLRDHERRAQFTVAQASFWRVSED